MIISFNDYLRKAVPFTNYSNEKRMFITITCRSFKIQFILVICSSAIILSVFKQIVKREIVQPFVEIVAPAC